MGANFSLPQYLMHPQLAGGSPDLSKVDEKVKGIVSQFKSATGTDMFTLTGSQFMQVLNALVQGGNAFKHSIVAPTQDGFRQIIQAPPEISDAVYMYYYKSGGTAAALAGGQSWWDSLFGPPATPTGPSSTPEAGNVAALLASVQPAAGTATTPATAVGGATVKPVTAANPAPGWGSYASNLTNSATDALIAQGNASAGIPPPAAPVPPPVVRPPA